MNEREFRHLAARTRAAQRAHAAWNGDGRQKAVLLGEARVLEAMLDAELAAGGSPPASPAAKPPRQTDLFA